jgi:hypothetical protein
MIMIERFCKDCRHSTSSPSNAGYTIECSLGEEKKRECEDRYMTFKGSYIGNGKYLTRDKHDKPKITDGNFISEDEMKL